ncbi:probable 6-phosphogluconolactonase 1 [Tanacetum coccineum]|uniref:Probable 6-phosphogluconolactonase 1 n=1 Tax=Tanacetum coccineum TaxID=301880 RepID=A0ABQ4XB79_9ASTR
MALLESKKDRGEVRIHESLEELSTDLADYIAELSEASVKERGFFAIALSGGSLISLMRNLCGAPYNKTVEWSKWYIFWADERVVAKNHVDSNYKLAKDHLLSKLPIVPSHVHSINDSLTAEESCKTTNVAVVVTGIGKAEAARQVIDDVGPECPVLPARMIEPAVGKLVWFLDNQAGSKLKCFSQFSK